MGEMTTDAPGAVKAILGPTNTGKTWFAIERMLAHRSGMIGLPLRLLAREVYQRVVDRVGKPLVALVTGEERLVPATARYWVCTVEAMPMDVPVECIAIDEVQVATDFERGHVFTDRILNARGISETLLMGAATMVPVIRALLPQAEIIHRPRFSHLTYAGSKKISRQPQRSAIVAFSARQVYAIAELIRRERGGAAVVMGALSPRTRNAQVDLYQNGDVDFLVATDAIGMGLNLDVHHVAFADDSKFDGRQTRPLTPAELGQIAGRAGRHMHDGTFGVTGHAEPFEEEMVVALETHDFQPVRVLQWRNTRLDFASLEALCQSLDAAPAHKALTRVPMVTDQQTLEFLARNEAATRATSPARVELLWQCCQLPDYRDISPAQHGELITRIFTDLADKGRINADWIAEQVRFCDNVSGDIDTLSNRIRQIRTWTFVANRRNWLEDPTHWREKTRDIEDRLSDALHERLTQRFVDRRTSVLMRHLRDRRMATPEINDRGEVTLEGHLIGSIEGFRFTLARSEGDGDAKGLRTAAAEAVAPEIRNRADRLAGAPNEEFVLATDGQLRWRGEVVATLAEGDTLLTPRLIILADEALSGVELERVRDRLNLWLRHAVNTQLESITALAEPADLDGPARGIAYRLYENLGIIPRALVADEVKALDQDVRAKMRKLGIKFGAYHLYVPMSLKPAPRELAIMLHALKNGGVRQPGVTELPQIVLSGRTSFLIDPAVSTRLYEIAGFKVAGRRAVRVDILERLADIIRPLIALDAARHPGDAPMGAAEGNGFRVTVEMTSLLGCSGEDFASILSSLGYRMRKVARKPAPAAVAPESLAGTDEIADLTTIDAITLRPDEAATPTIEAQELADAARLDAAPAEAALGAETEVAETDSGALAAVEGTPAETQGEQQEVAQATADLGAPAPDAPKGVPAQAEAGEATAAEPEFEEIWYPGGRRNEQQRPGRNRGRRANGSETAEGAETSERPRNAERASERSGERPPRERPPRPEGQNRGPRPEGQGRPQRPPHQRPGGPEQRPADGKGANGPGKFRPKREDKPREERWKGDRPARREQAYDPDSPFAKLAALRNLKPE
jgi:ATP-dependent RNA helicase SUPV3L1/SUV3